MPSADSFHATVYARRSVKQFDPNYVVPAATEQRLLQSALRTPSSFNIQHWRVLKITDRALRQQLRAAAWDQAQVTDASLLYVICADVQAWQKEPHRYWRKAAPATQKVLLPMINAFYSGKPQLQRDEALRSVGMFAQTLMLAAQAEGLASCPMIGFDPQAVAGIIKLPDDHIIGMFVTIGRGVEAARPHGGYLPLNTVIRENTF